MNTDKKIIVRVSPCLSVAKNPGEQNDTIKENKNGNGIDAGVGIFLFAVW
jgi:hypothetical protein